MTVGCAAAFENRLADNRGEGEQADIYLGLKKTLRKSITEDWKGMLVVIR